jgi:putative peptide zinc metalloprotease protein
MTLRRRVVAVLVAAFIVPGGWLASGGVATASQDTSAVAINTKDGSSVFRLAFSIRRVMGDVVDQQNAAVAYASCESCQTVAISIQVLLVMGDPEVVTPENLALAINQDCTLCQTLASAYQFVVGFGTKVMLTPEGRQQLEEIRRQLRELGRDDLPIEETQARTDTLMDSLRQVLDSDLVAKEPKGGGSGQDTSPSSAAPASQPEQPPPTTETSPTTPEQTTPEQTTPTEPPPETTGTQPDSGTVTQP